MQGRTKIFRDLIVWQKSMALAKDVYRITEGFPRAEQFGLTSQMRRSAVSVPSNIAEGHGRLTDAGFRVFLAQARGSLYELQTQIELAVDLGFCEAEAAEPVMNTSFEVARILKGLLRALRTPQQQPGMEVSMGHQVSDLGLQEGPPTSNRQGGR